MHYSFRNTLCGLAVVIAASLLAEQTVAQTVTLLDETDTVSLSPTDEGAAAPEEISLFDEQMGDVSLPGGGLLSPAQPADSVDTDVIPMEGSMGEDSSEQISLSVEDETALEPNESKNDNGLNMVVEGEAPSKTVSNTPPMVTGKLLAPKTTGGFDENISPSISNDLFARMSDLEKQTTLLNLELKKERVQNEIAAVKAQRLKAQQEEEARKAEEERKRREWENEQERLMVAEQTKLKEAAAALEALRQEKIVKAYKATLLGATQRWIKTNAEVYAKMAKKDAEIKQILEENAKKMTILKQKATDLKSKSETARIAHDKKVANLESQISILKTRLEAEIESSKKKIAAAKAESKSGRKNPFATASGIDITASLIPGKVKLSNEYAIMEITGRGEELAAKLINTDGDIFMAKVGTTLRNGYTIDEITQTYLSAVKDNTKDLLYFSAGGILDQEPVPSDITMKQHTNDPNGNNNSSSGKRQINTTQGIPSLGQGMFIR